MICPDHSIFMLTAELTDPLNSKMRLFASWLYTTLRAPHLHIAFNSFVHLTGYSHRVHSPSVESSPLLLYPMFTSCWKPLPSFVSWLVSSPQWKVPTLSTVIVFGNINHTNLPFELPNDKQQMTRPCGQNTTLKQGFMSNTDAYRLLLQALQGLSDHVMLLLLGSVSSV